jgi:PAS domain S-box-containing protein
LRHSEEVNRRIIASSGDGIAVLDRDGRLLSMTERGLSMLEIDDIAAIRGRSWVEGWLPPARDLAQAALEQARTGGTGRFEGAYPTASGALRWWDVVVTGILGSTGAIEQLLATARDITAGRLTLQRLQDTEQRFRYLAESMPQLVWMADPDGHVRWANRHWLAYMGTSIDTARDEGWTAFHADDRERMFAAWQRSLAELIPYQIEVRILGAGQRDYRWFLVRAVPALDDAGSVRSWIGTCTDIHDLKRSEDALRQASERDREREQQLRLALEAGSIGTWHALAGQPVLVADQRAFDLFGAAGGRPLTYRAILACIHPHDRRAVESAVRRLRRADEPDTVACEYRTLTEDGVVRFIKATGRVHRAADGSVTRLDGTILDLSDQRRADERDRLQAAAGAMLVASFDAPEVLTAIANLLVERFADWCAFDLADGQDVLQRIVVAHRHPELVAVAHHLHRTYPPRPDSPSLAVFRTGEPFLLEAITDEMITLGAVDAEHARLVRSLGLRSLITVPVVARGRNLGVMVLATAQSRRRMRADDLAFALELGRRIGLAIDNSRLFALEQQARAFAVERAETLSQLNAELEQFAYVCSHDLQEPLRHILQYLELTRMRLGAALDERAQRYMAYVTASAERMRLLIIDLLGYARVGNAVQPAPQEVELERVLAESIANLQMSITASGAVITHDPLPVIMGEKIQLVQVLQNLLSNAIKFRREEPPRIHISAETTEREWIVTVRDNGIGIPDGLRQKIFEVFQRLHPADRYAGSGIGLAICRKIIARSGGRIWAEGADGPGSVFRFALPRRTELPPRASATVPAASQPGAAPPLPAMPPEPPAASATPAPPAPPPSAPI